MKKLLTIIVLSLFLVSCQGRSYPVYPSDKMPHEVLPPETAATTSVEFAIVDIEGEGEEKIGCGDTLVMVSKSFDGTLTTEEKITKALEALFAIKSYNYGQSGLFNGLGDQTDLQVDKVEINGEQTTVWISGKVVSGGTCDDPRIEEQIKETVNANRTTRLYGVILNGASLEDYFNMQ